METTSKGQKRIPVGSARDILTVANKDPNYFYRWVLDDPKRPGRLQRFLSGGYEVVTDEEEVGQKTVDRSNKKLGSAITRPDGGSTLVLMRILKEWYDEDQAAKQDKITSLESTMNRDAKEGRIPGTNEPGYGTLTIERKK